MVQIEMVMIIILIASDSDTCKVSDNSFMKLYSIGDSLKLTLKGLRGVIFLHLAIIFILSIMSDKSAPNFCPLFVVGQILFARFIYLRVTFCDAICLMFFIALQYHRHHEVVMNACLLIFVSSDVILLPRNTSLLTTI